MRNKDNSQTINNNLINSKLIKGAIKATGLQIELTAAYNRVDIYLLGAYYATVKDVTAAKLIGAIKNAAINAPRWERIINTSYEAYQTAD